MKAGVDGRPIVFLFADTQIALENFTEDINMILNTGDVPNLYAPEEKAEILEKMQVVSRDSVHFKFQYACVYEQSYILFIAG